jgi:hypothetical protein
MARKLLITLLTIATAAILAARSSDAAALTLEKALQVPALERAQACSSLDLQRGFLRLAEAGVNVVIDGRAGRARVGRPVRRGGRGWRGSRGVR